MNYHALTKKVDHSELLAALTAAGVTMGVAIDDERITLRGDVMAEGYEADLAAQLVIVAAVESAHVPSTITTASLSVAPHIERLVKELLAVDGVSNVGVQFPADYPGTIVVRHNSLDADKKAALVAAAEAHDASSVPYLSVDVGSQVIAADGSTTGTVTVSDSRGASAAGKTVRLKLPPNVAVVVDSDAFVLDAAGEATATFGATSIPTGEMTLQFYYESEEADPVDFTVRRGTA